LNFIGNALEAKRAGHPDNVVFLTCDASGVLPPISRLTPDQAVYHFMSGYTSKIAGTEIGLGIEPVITFSACFGAPFMVHHPYKYAQMLKVRILKHKAKVWMVNTGWTGGPFGIGKRISIQHTRALLDAALNGKLDGVEYAVDPVFGVEVPKSCEGVPSSILDPANTWPSREEYNQRVRSLASRFIENFELLSGEEAGARGLEVHGPKLHP
jgi:phosphoenolpyruvate carboxykinase (ATP)